MKRTTFTLLILLAANFLYAQQEMTLELLKTITASVQQKSDEFKAKLVSADELTKDQIEFAVDTFKIERVTNKWMEMDQTTIGMVEAENNLASMYDIVLNKYYKKLLNSLKEDDKKVLITAQRVWLNFRDSELKLVGVLTKEEYSGGGSIQANIAAGAYSDIIKKRTNEIFSYYNEIQK
jgi:uncharacterized protein YecT (DUF1311 family)